MAKEREHPFGSTPQEGDLLKQHYFVLWWAPEDCFNLNQLGDSQMGEAKSAELI